MGPQGESKVAGPVRPRTKKVWSPMMERIENKKWYFHNDVVFLIKTGPVVNSSLSFLFFFTCWYLWWWTDTLAMAAEMVRPLRRWGIDLLGGRTRKSEGNFLFYFSLTSNDCYYYFGLLLFFPWERFLSKKQKMGWGSLVCCKSIKNLKSN